jgi:hypothetical protein
VRNALADPLRLVVALGLGKDAQRQAGGMLVCCPSHGERHPSCSITRGPDGTVRVRCFACDFSADAIGLVALVRGLPTRGDGFRETLAEAAEVGGLLSLASELRGGQADPARRRAERPLPPPLEPEVEYPDPGEVNALWGAAGPVADDPEASGAVVARRVDPEAVDRLRLARAVAPGAELPRWARYRGESWGETGHRLVVRAWDAAGQCRSVRAWRVSDSDTPKRLPPAGCRAAGLVLANRQAVAMLLGRSQPRRLLVVEGEPDWLVASVVWSDCAVVGIGSGAWGEAFADRVPDGCEVLLMTHPDPAGERYAEAVAKTLGERVRLWRAA